MSLSQKTLVAVCALLLAAPLAAVAETCTTQSQMQPAERDTLKAAAEAFARKIQHDDQAAIRSETIAEFQTNFSSLGNIVTATSQRVADHTPQVDQLYLLDASAPGKNADSGTSADAQFYCSLNKTQAEVTFSIPQLPTGRYAFASVYMDGAKPWLVSLLLRQHGTSWQLAGLYPKALTAGGHDSLWYWRQGRELESAKQPWNAWLYLQEAQALSQPAAFVSSTHLDKLQAEITAAAPPALSGGLDADNPLVVKGADGTEYRFTSIGVDDSLAADRPDISAHIKVPTLGDAALAKQRNAAAMAALLAAHPELRKNFHGVSLYTDPADGSPYGTESAMADIR